MAILSDEEARISDRLLSTPLSPSEYVWGKFLGILGAFSSANLLATFFYHGVPDPTMAARPVGFLRGTVAVAGTELKNLLASPGLYCSACWS